jgi:RecB family endonuclease NucS
LETTSDKIRALGREGYGPAEIGRFLNIRYQFAYNVLARAGLVGVTRAEGEPDVAVAEVEDEALVDEAIERRFALERDLQKALRENIEQLEVGLKIVDDGKERKVAAGFIDITAEDKQGATVAIELKAGIADYNAVAQLLSYIGDLMVGTDQVRGILVAGDFAQRAISAARAAPNIVLRKYAFQFSFEPVK